MLLFEAGAMCFLLAFQGREQVTSNTDFFSAAIYPRYKVTTIQYN